MKYQHMPIYKRKRIKRQKKNQRKSNIEEWKNILIYILLKNKFVTHYTNLNDHNCVYLRCDESKNTKCLKHTHNSIHELYTIFVHTHKKCVFHSAESLHVKTMKCWIRIFLEDFCSDLRIFWFSSDLRNFTILQWS